MQHFKTLIPGKRLSLNAEGFENVENICLKDYSLTDIIVNGLGKQPFPRDYISQTEERLDLTKNHVWAMKQGLRRKGYKVK